MIDEEISRSTIAISVRASKLTARGLAYALGEAAKKIRKSQAPQGKQTVKQLLRQVGETSAIDLPGRAKDFDRVARRWGVDYAIKRVEKGKYLLFFKAKQADAITGCFSEYSRRMMNRSRDRRVPLREQLKRAQELVRDQPRQKEQTKEAEREER
ncbi:PcfB family protein [Flavonifractor plautii]|uniref:PcfB family protein n=1 Tax=Flavonifractor plautii TaxID=292800 RepID=UPI00214BDCBB|nr:PcfB family protein [Flavonifractor plautii]MCR1920310.1 PcfB family protein [Flavonifractor plautii]